MEESGTKTRASHSDENNKQERRRPCRLNIDSPLQRNNVERRREREKKLVSLCSCTTAAAENERVVHWRKILVLKNTMKKSKFRNNHRQEAIFFELVDRGEKVF